MANTVPNLLNALRPTVGDVAQWVGKSRDLITLWIMGRYQPRPDDRTALVRAIRKHANRLLALAEKVEREGNQEGRSRPLQTGTED